MKPTIYCWPIFAFDMLLLTNYISLKKIILSALCFLIIAINNAGAQEIYFCSHISDQGTPIGASKSWTLGDNGGYIYILCSNHKKHIKSKSLIAHIMKKYNGQYMNYEKRAMELQLDNTIATLDYQFTEEGNYLVSIEDNTGKQLAVNDLSIKLIKKSTLNTPDSVPDIKGAGILKNSKDPMRSYYHARTIFCKTIINGLPSDSSAVFPAGEVNVVVINDHSLESDSMFVDVFKKGYETEKYPIYITTKTIKIDRNKNQAGLTLSFDQTGQYKVVAYNNRSQTISEGYLTIR